MEKLARNESRLAKYDSKLKLQKTNLEVLRNFFILNKIKAWEIPSFSAYVNVSHWKYVWLLQLFFVLLMNSGDS